MIDAKSKQTGKQQFEAIREDLACPDCDCKLNGSAGRFVDCPGCGQRIDIALLRAGQRPTDWRKTPGLERLRRPALLAVFGVLLSPLLAMVCHIFMLRTGFSLEGIDFQSLTVLFLFLFLCIWFVLMWKTINVFQNRWLGPCLSCLGHLVFAGYLVGIGCFLYAGLGIVGGLMFGNLTPNVSPISPCVFILIFLVAGVGLFYGGRRAEKFIAACCIREYLRRQSRID